MNKKLQILNLGLIAFISIGLYAQDYGVNDNLQDDQGGEAVQAAQDNPYSAPKVNVVSSQAALTAYLKDKLNIRPGYDSKKDRIIVIDSAGDNLTRSDLKRESFVDQRSLLAVEAQLKTKSRIIESIISKMSASQILDMPGNPIAKKLKGRKEALDAKMKAANDKVEAMRSLIAKSQGALDQAIIDDLNGISVNDRFGALLDGIIKRVDETYNKEDLSADKKARIHKLREQMIQSRDLFVEAEQQRTAVMEEAKKIHGDLKKSIKISVNKQAEMPIFGAVVLATTESYDNNQYRVSVAMAWSPKLEKNARSILLGKKENLTPKPNKNSFEDWVYSIDLSTTFGTRQYLASDGKRYYVGIVANSYDPNDYDTLDEARDFSDLFAEQECVLSLFSQMSSQKTAEKLALTIDLGDGRTETEILKSRSKTMKAEIKDMSISGLTIVRSEEGVIHPISGQTMYVAVAAVDSDLAAKSQEFMTEAYATLKEVNEDQSFKKGLYSGMKDDAAASKNDPKAMAEGYEQGRQGVQSSVSQRKAQEKPKNTYIAPSKESATSNNQSGNVQTGTYIGGADVDDDF